ncbi:hypothetical protein glysoja_028426 [Glycine soja]|uniref:Uncharacterized protein n=1 Tax=Glycine soja TaxID=3848 RepID=A0A0B2SLX1_GLYSO|nr:hypothetical protein glysoja_028426 [Glycine soja]
MENVTTSFSTDMKLLIFNWMHDVSSTDEIAGLAEMLEGFRQL